MSNALQAHYSGIPLPTAANMEEEDDMIRHNMQEKYLYQHDMVSTPVSRRSKSQAGYEHDEMNMFSRVFRSFGSAKPSPTTPRSAKMDGERGDDTPVEFSYGLCLGLSVFHSFLQYHGAGDVQHRISEECSSTSNFVSFLNVFV